MTVLEIVVPERILDFKIAVITKKLIACCDINIVVEKCNVA